MLWVKFLCILYAMFGLQIAITPPHPPPPLCEQLASTPLEAVLRQRWGPVFVKGFCWAIAMFEMTVIVASQFPCSQQILTTLVVEGRIERIHVSPLFFFGISLTLLGASLRYWCYRELGVLFTFEASIRADHTLIQTGPYTFVRHPGYTGLLLTIAGFCCWNASPGSWLRESGALQTAVGSSLALICGLMVVCITTGLLLRIPREDRALAEKFGEIWVQWSRRVPYKLLPGVF